MSIRIVLVGDYALVRKGLNALLQERQDFQVVGEADSGPDAVRVVAERTPDIVVMGVTLAALNSIEATRRIRQSSPRVRVLALSTHRDPLFVTGMLKAGASGYILKTCTVPEFFQAIDVVARGMTYLSPEIAGVVAEAAANPESGALLLSGVTPVQRQVLQLLAEGLNTKQAAMRLGRSVKTVEMHRRNVMDKLHVNGIASLVKVALRAGLVSNDV